MDTGVCTILTATLPFHPLYLPIHQPLRRTQTGLTGLFKVDDKKRGKMKKISSVDDSHAFDRPSFGQCGPWPLFWLS